MKFSLIMATLGRDQEIEVFIESLLAQSYKNYELIIVDQNLDDRVERIYTKYKKVFEFKYFKSNVKGLSYNRNIGLDLSNGNIVAFPDDDCEYQIDTLEKIVSFFKKNDTMNIYSCGVQDKKTKDKFKFLINSQEITRNNLMQVGCSITFFIRKKENFKLKFDSRLGVGGEFGSGEETDFISSLLFEGYKGYYHADTYIYHEVKQLTPTVQRYYTYGMGYGALSKKEIKLRKNKKFIYDLFKQIIKSIIGMLFIKSKCKYHYYHLKGIMKGLISY